ncbi:MAG TPA: hypothetical protein VGH93_07865 [Solirubrobacteraceae bacterium]|jgi:predicted enzyme related to lactoylglutathione lyase
MRNSSPTPVAHLELHTGDLPGARALCAQLCGWRSERIVTGSGSYLAVELGRDLGGGIVECGTDRATWLPYVEVSRIDEATVLARRARRIDSARAARGPRRAGVA